MCHVQNQHKYKCSIYGINKSKANREKVCWWVFVWVYQAILFTSYLKLCFKTLHINGIYRKHKYFIPWYFNYHMNIHYLKINPSGCGTRIRLLQYVKGLKKYETLSLKMLSRQAYSDTHVIFFLNQLWRKSFNHVLNRPKTDWLWPSDAIWCQDCFRWPDVIYWTSVDL